MLQQHHESPFNNENLEYWIDQRQTEADLLISFVERLEDTQFVPFSRFYSQTREFEEIITLRLYFPNQVDPIIAGLQRYIDDESVDSNDQDDRVDWFNDLAVLDNITYSIDDLVQYQQANLNTSIAFVFTVIQRAHHGQTQPFANTLASTRRGRRSSSASFSPPHAPTGLQINSTENSSGFSCQWEEPEFGSKSVLQYELEVTEIGTEPNTIRHIFHTGSKVEHFDVTLENSTPYSVAVKGIGRIGETFLSNSVVYPGVSARLVGGAGTSCPRRSNSGRLEVRCDRN